jgi:hypothetical protein
MNNQTEWNKVYGGVQEGADAWSEVAKQQFSTGEAHQVQLTYFMRTSGEFYASGTFDTTLDSMWRIVEYVRSLQSSGEHLPGLATDGRDFIILVDSETRPNAYPQLILSE